MENFQAPEALKIASQSETAALRRHLLSGRPGVVVWFTGLSGAGKSTLAFGLELRLLRMKVMAAVLDGDVLRTGLCNDLGFSELDRRENIRRCGEAAILMASAGVVAIVALISPFRADRQAIAENCASRGIHFLEFFVNAPLEVCERRDPKNLYKKARRGLIPCFTGIDSPYEEPMNPSLALQTDTQSIDDCLACVQDVVFPLLDSKNPEARVGDAMVPRAGISASV